MVKGTRQLGHWNCAPEIITACTTPDALSSRSMSDMRSTSSTVPSTMSPSNIAMPSTSTYCTGLTPKVSPRISAVRTGPAPLNSPVLPLPPSFAPPPAARDGGFFLVAMSGSPVG